MRQTMVEIAKTWNVFFWPPLLFVFRFLSTTEPTNGFSSYFRSYQMMQNYSLFFSNTAPIWWKSGHHPHKIHPWGSFLKGWKTLEVMNFSKFLLDFISENGDNMLTKLLWLLHLLFTSILLIIVPLPLPLPLFLYFF